MWSEIGAFGAWWLVMVLLGWLAWPVAALFFRWLPDRGFSLSKALGLLLSSYLLWILGSFGFLDVTRAGALMALVLLFGLSLLALRAGENAVTLGGWLGRNWKTVVALEVLFVVAFGVWAYVRALNPEIVATEKPMEFAFLNSVLATASLPPRDPWLSGFAISYYYFGYIQLAMMTALTQTLPSMAFNLGVALLFGLTVTTATGVGLNLVAATAQQADDDDEPREVLFAVWPGLLAGVLVGVVGNFNGLLEVLHYRDLLPDGFWVWLDIQYTRVPPTAPGVGWVPERFLWWWQSSRILVDQDLRGVPIGLNPIDEFPFFSFLLGDVHPHVLALPFVALAVGAALNLYLRTRAEDDADRPVWLPLPPIEMVFGAVLLGGLAFLNTWDFPIYVFVTVAGYLAARQVRLGADATVEGVWGRAAALGGWLAALGVVLYAPFYVGFRSQAGGLAPNPVHSSRFVQVLVMFGPVLVLALAWVTWVVSRRFTRMQWGVALASGPGLLALLALVMVTMSAVVVMRAQDDPNAQAAVISLIGDVPINEAVGKIIERRIGSLQVGIGEGLLTPVVMSLMIGAAAGLIFFVGGQVADSAGFDGQDTLTPFVLVLLATGALLVLGAEFLYLRDAFGVRMNTVFKFYYQAWVLWALAGAFGVWQVLRYASLPLKAGMGTLATVVVMAGLVYTVAATTTKTEQFQGTTFNEAGERFATLDGMAYMRTNYRAADYYAMMWVRDNVPADAVIAESIGGSYSENAQVAAHTGRATVLGWPFHQYQWRGSYEPVGSREADIELLYRARTWQETLPVLDRYGITYVYVGPKERQAYGEGGLVKFGQFMDLVYDANGVQVYRRR